MPTRGPTVWRRWLALELARLRRAAGYDHTTAADKLGVTRPMVSYIESASRGVSEAMLPQMLRLYGVPEFRWAPYQLAVRESRQQGWWQRDYDTRTVPNWFSLYVGLEQGAVDLKVFQSTVIDGLLQTIDYAEAAIDATLGERGVGRVSELAQMRVDRQGVLTRVPQEAGEPGPLQLSVVLDEAAIRRVVGSPAIMSGQLVHIANVTEMPNVTVQVLPFESGGHPGLVPFKVIDLGFPEDPGLVYIEYWNGAIYLETKSELDDHVAAHADLRNRALTPDESVTLIRSVAREVSQ